MQKRLLHILAVCVAGWLTLLSENSYGQEDGLPLSGFQEPGHSELNLDEDKSLLYDFTENKPSRTVQSIQREATVQAKAKEQKETSRKPEEKGKNEEDAYSFNFLYYIIQKYKISDIVDQ